MNFRIPDWLKYEIRHRFEQHTFVARKWVNESPSIIAAITTASVLILATVIIILLIPNGDQVSELEQSAKAWFYDVNVGKLFTSKANQTIPASSPWGPLANGLPAGVKAHVFSYSVEPNESQLFIGYLEKPDPNFQPSEPDSVKLGTSGAKDWAKSRLIRRLEDKQWYPANSTEGRVILQGLYYADANGLRAIYQSPK